MPVGVLCSTPAGIGANNASIESVSPPSSEPRAQRPQASERTTLSGTNPRLASSRCAQRPQASERTTHAARADAAAAPQARNARRHRSEQRDMAKLKEHLEQ